MKNLVSIAVSIALLVGCAGYEPRTDFGKDVVAWWHAPSTQEGVKVAKQAALTFAVTAGLAALQQYAGGGQIDYGKIAMAGGVATLYTQASAIRRLQGTVQVLDPEATARLLQEGGTPKEISRELAAQLFENASALIAAGVPADDAAEINAAGLDKAAGYIEVAQTVGAKP